MQANIKVPSGDIERRNGQEKVNKIKKPTKSTWFDKGMKKLSAWKRRF